MLTIKGIEKLFRQDIGEWRIAKVETINSAYLIQLRKSNGENLQVNLERNKDNGYELWHWKSIKGTIRPNRLVLPITQFQTMDGLMSAIYTLIK